MKLLYSATDWRFANDAICELRAAGIPCYRPSLYLPSQTTVEAVSEETAATYADPNPKDFEETPEEAARREAGEKTESPLFTRTEVQFYPIYVERDEDYERASEILIKLGAAKDVMLKDSTVEAINYWSIALAVLTVVVVLLFIVESRH